jgi:predicted transcriptional regulator
LRTFSKTATNAIVLSLMDYSFTSFFIKPYIRSMLTAPVKLAFDDILASLPTLDNTERTKLQNALFDLQNDLDLHQAISEGLDDLKNGRVGSHDMVMSEIREKHGV